jgi:hypothetical protein
MNFYLLSFVIFLILPITGFAKDITLDCPQQIHTTQQMIDTPAGFTSMSSPSTHYWTSVTFYSGEPKEQASLAPDKTSKGKMHWVFSENDTIYLSCGYNQTQLELYKKLPNHIHSCTVFFDTTVMTVGGGVPKKIAC